MELTKIRNWSDDELKVQEKQFSEQLFRIRFQAKLGQNEGVKKLRDLRKDIARIKTVSRERTLGIHGAEPVEVSIAPVKTKKIGKTKKEAK
jgi:large subunit ribosomal protein L29